MSSVSARHDNKWWPKSSKNSSSNSTAKAAKDLSHSFVTDTKIDTRKSSSPMKFSTFTNAMGFKSKKHTSIQEPTSATVLDPSALTVRYTNRPPATSFSTTQSWDDEPQTPADSIMDVSRWMQRTPESSNFPSSPGLHSRSAMHDPNRLSAYSGSFMSDVGKGDLSAFNRASYASSSNSQFPGFSTNSSATSVIDGPPPSPLTQSNTQRQKPNSLSPPTIPASWENVVDLGEGPTHPRTPLSKSGSLLTLTDRNSRDSSQNAPRIRPRGATDGEHGWSPQSKSNSPHTEPLPRIASLPPPKHEWSKPPVRPRVLVRQASASRVGPPRAPPVGCLPPPPSNPILRTHDPSDSLDDSPTSTSSTMSFAPISGRPHTADRARPAEGSKDFKTSPNHVRKSMSNQSFAGRSSSIHIPRSNPSSPSDAMGDRAPRKQRSFHHNTRLMTPPVPSPARLPPPIPIQSHPASPSASTSTSDTTPHYFEVSQRSFTNSFVRKRLFSNASSSKRPPSQGISVGDEDQRSLFTGESEQLQDMSISSSASSTTSAVFGTSPPDDPPGSLVSAVEHTSQRIMSPAEMLRWEATFNEPDSHEPDNSRQRLQSFILASTSISNLGDSKPPHYIIDRGSKRGALIYASTMDESLALLLPNSPRPTSSSQTKMPASASDSPSSIRTSFVPALPGLPLPPRPRRQTAPSLSLSPAPTRRYKTSNPIVQPRSIMKKPSFLEIEDEKSPVASSSGGFGGSFLEMEKSSFDTIR